MPWTPSDAKSKTKSASTPKKSRQWSDIANKLYSSGVPEGQAIREANGVLKREKGKSK